MVKLKEYFVENARISRGSVARFAEASREDIEQMADDLNLGDRLTYEEAQELLLALEDGCESDADDGEDDELEAADDEDGDDE